MGKLHMELESILSESGPWTLLSCSFLGQWLRTGKVQQGHFRLTPLQPASGQDEIKARPAAGQLRICCRVR